MILQTHSWAFFRENYNSKRYMHPNVHNSTIYNSQDLEATKCPSTDEWIKKMWYIYTMEYYSARKKSEIFSLQQHGGTWRISNNLLFIPYESQSTS